AAVALFFLPALLGIGNPPASSAPSGSPGASARASASAPAASPTALPAATQQVYVVQAGDTMSKIANRFGVPLQALIDANKATIPNPDRLNIGDQVVIPASTPTSLPGVSPSP
ncbi:MAG: LysM peptidoglycan-binding domain-containing protein, partial [Chloroflexi bacterium]|nr:LysM peptidoglycan-binding domain-containing protein [Chloroflexota bacterium]